MITIDNQTKTVHLPDDMSLDEMANFLSNKEGTNYSHYKVVIDGDRWKSSDEGDSEQTIRDAWSGD